MRLRGILAPVGALILLVSQFGSALAWSAQPPSSALVMDSVSWAGELDYVQCGGPIPETNVDGHEIQLDNHEFVGVRKDLTPEGEITRLFLFGKLANQCKNPGGPPNWMVCQAGDEIRVIEERGPHTSVSELACLTRGQKRAQIFITGPLWPKT